MSGKRCHRWLDEEVIKFLHLYKNMECLWNSGLRDHKDKNKREQAYEIVRKQMGLSDLTVLDVKNKIRGIRTTYSDELYKIVASIRSEVKGEIYKPKVFWFNLADSFLREVTKHGSQTSVKQKDESSFTSDEPANHHDHEDQDYSEYSHPTEWPQLLPEQPSPEKNLNSVLGSKEEDEYDLFGRSMAMQLRKLPELTSLELMQKMQLMILNTRKQLSKEKVRTKPRTAKSHASTSNATKRVATPSSDLSSPGSPSCYKFEVLSPCESDPTSGLCEASDRSFTYVTTVKHAEDSPSTGQVSEDVTSNVTIDIKREMKRKLSSSVDPLEVKQNKLSHSLFNKH